jgi:signal transduction histidine kinase
VVESLLDLACAEAHTLRLIEAPGDPNQLVRGVAEMHDPAARVAGLRVEVADTWAPDCVLFDRRRVQQVVDNLVSNAIKYTPSGGAVRIGVEERRDTELGPVLDFRVQDTGRGMDTEEMDLIFDEFYRRTEHNKIQGSGLGLAISRKLAGLMGGTLSVASTPDVGSTFTLSIPLRVALAHEVVAA